MRDTASFGPRGEGAGVGGDPATPCFRLNTTESSVTNLPSGTQNFATRFYLIFISFSKEFFDICTSHMEK